MKNRYNKLERAEIYAATTLGAILPVAAYRGIMGGFNLSWNTEIASWICSAVTMSVPSAVGALAMHCAAEEGILRRRVNALRPEYIAERNKRKELTEKVWKSVWF